MRAHAARELEVNDLQQRLEHARSQSGGSRAATLRAQVESTEKLLEEARAAVAESSARHDALVAERRDADRQLQALYQKQGARAQFATQAERDAWLKGEIATLRGALEDSNRAARDAEDRRSALEGELQTIQQVLRCMSFICAVTVCAQEAEAKQADVARHESDALARKADLERLQQERAELVATRRSLFREEGQLATWVMMMRVACMRTTFAAVIIGPSNDSGLRQRLAPRCSASSASWSGRFLGRSTAASTASSASCRRKTSSATW